MTRILTDHRKSLRTKHRIFIDIRKAKNNFDKNRKSKYFDCNIYKHITKDYRKPKKKKNIRKCYKCEKIRYITRDCRIE